MPRWRAGEAAKRRSHTQPAQRRRRERDSEGRSDRKGASRKRKPRVLARSRSQPRTAPCRENGGEGAGTPNLARKSLRCWQTREQSRGLYSRTERHKASLWQEASLPKADAPAAECLIATPNSVSFATRRGSVNI